MSNNLSLMNETLELGSTDNQLNEESVENTRIEDEQASEQLAFSGDVATDNGVPAWEHESRMAFHILFDASDRDAPDKIPTRVRRPYPGRPALYKKDEHFMKHETRQVLDALMPEGAKYGVVTFEASGKDGGKNMAEMAKYLCRNGWIEGDERYRVVYADVNGTGTMILVSSTAHIKRLKDLGVFISSDPKAPKRMRRTMAAHQVMVEAKVIRSYAAETGQVTLAQLKNGRIISILDFNMKLLDSQATAFLDGSGVINLPGFDGCAATLVGPFGLGKGIYATNERMSDYDIYLYGTKDEVIFHGDHIYIGMLLKVSKHDLMTDLQTITNAGFYEEDLCVRSGYEAMDERAKVLFGDDEDAITDYFATLVNVSDEARRDMDMPKAEWALVRSMKLQHESKTMPVLYRRIFKHGFQDSLDISKGRIPLKGAIRVYARPNPLVMLPNGLPDFSSDTLGGELDGLPTVCIPDLPDGQVLLGRNPNTNSTEMALVRNITVPELREYKEQGWCFFGANAGDILGLLNGGDMDDNLFAIQAPAFIAKWQTMDYPVQPKLTVKVREVSAFAKTNREKWLGIGDEWNFNCFAQQLREFTEYSESLGSFINNGWLDTLLSGEHRVAIGESLTTGTFVVPENFTAQLRSELLQLLPADQAKVVPAEYEPTLDWFVYVASLVNAAKPDFICARAMSNSDMVIDYTRMRKGDKLTVMSLFAEAKEALKTMVFPISFADRIPRDRRKAGNYLLVETKVCKALRLLSTRRDQLLEESRQVEHMIKRPLATKLLTSYPADESIHSMLQVIRSWRRQQFQEAKAANGGCLPDDAYDRIHNGHTETVMVKGETGEITGIQEIRTPGLIDFYANQFSVSGNVLSISGRPWSVETRRKLGIHWLNSVYTRNADPLIGDDNFTQSVGDGVPNFILDDVLSAEEDLGLTGWVAFVDLNGYAKRRLRQPVVVKVIGGSVLHRSNDRLLSRTPDLTIPNGSYMMSPKGVIHVDESVPELHSNYKSAQVAHIASEDFEFGEDSNF